MGTPTATVRAFKPAVGGDLAPTWPNEINLSFDMFDRAANQRLSIALADANMTLTADGSTADQANYQGLNFTGALSAARTVTLPSCQKYGWVQNSTTGGFAISLATAGVGTTLSVPADGVQYTYFCDGTNVVSLTIPSFSAANIIGTTTNDSAAAGRLGEYISSTVLSGSAVALPTNGTAANVTSISLTAGDWDVSGTVCTTVSGTCTQVNGWISTTSASIPTFPNSGAVTQITPSSSLGNVSLPVGSTRLSLASTTTVYLSMAISATVGGVSGYGFIGARRAR